jgi:hypothetical protein
MIVLNHYRLKPDLRFITAVQNVNVRRFISIGRIESKFVTIDQNRRHFKPARVSFSKGKF